MSVGLKPTLSLTLMRYVCGINSVPLTLIRYAREVKTNWALNLTVLGSSTAGSWVIQETTTWCAENLGSLSHTGNHHLMCRKFGFTESYRKPPPDVQKIWVHWVIQETTTWCAENLGSLSHTGNHHLMCRKFGFTESYRKPPPDVQKIWVHWVIQETTTWCAENLGSLSHTGNHHLMCRKFGFTNTPSWVHRKVASESVV